MSTTFTEQTLRWAHTTRNTDFTQLVQKSHYSSNYCELCQETLEGKTDIWVVHYTIQNVNFQQKTFKTFLMFIWETERQRQRQSTSKEGQRERETQNPKQAPGSSCQHRARHGARSHKPWDHDLSWSQTLNRLSHPGASPKTLFTKSLFIYFEVEKEWMGGQRERGTEDPTWALCWRQRAWCGAKTHKSWDRDLSWSRMLNQLSHRAPQLKNTFEACKKTRTWTP